MSTQEAEVVPEWQIVDGPAGKLVLTVHHARTFRQYLSGKGERAVFVLTRRQALALSRELLEAADKS